MKNEPLIKLTPAIKEHVWGGTKIRDMFGKDVGGALNVAESWEVSTHPDGASLIAAGQFKGKTLNEYFGAVGWDRLGEYGRQNRRLPVMVKYIDACGDLSVQVHPSDGYARLHENDDGKNEIWFIVDAAEDAFIYLGFNRDVTQKEVRDGVQKGTVLELLNKVRVKRGEAYFIPAGTVHAIGKGCFICEVQQTSNVTYRLYDYGRLGLDGKPRELHLQKALDVLDYSGREVGETYACGGDRLGGCLNELFCGKAAGGLYMYGGERFKISGPVPRISFVIVYGGSGNIFCDGENRAVFAGDTWLADGRELGVCGDCRAIIISMWDR